MSEGIWLDQLPFVPPLVACRGCDDPLQPGEVMVKILRGVPITPLCSPCYDRLPDPPAAQPINREDHP